MGDPGEVLLQGAVPLLQRGAGLHDAPVAVGQHGGDEVERVVAGLLDGEVVAAHPARGLAEARNPLSEGQDDEGGGARTREQRARGQGEG